MPEFVLFESKTSSCLVFDGGENKKAKGTKKCVVVNLIFSQRKNYENYDKTCFPRKT